MRTAGRAMNNHRDKGPAPAAAGVDIGRVLMGGEGDDSSFLSGTEEEAMEAPEMPGAFESVRALCEALEGRVWLVSKCGPKIEGRSRRWLERQRFYEQTGLARENLRFCRERKEKAVI